MNYTSLKSNLHKLIDQIDNPNLLEEYYQEMKSIIQKSQVNVWDTLTEDQKKEVLLSYEESEDENNLIDTKSVLNKYKDLI
jgi:phage shock protein A